MRQPISISNKGKSGYSKFYVMLYDVRNMYPNEPFPISKMGYIIDDELKLELEEDFLKDY